MFAYTTLASRFIEAWEYSEEQGHKSVNWILYVFTGSVVYLFKICNNCFELHSKHLTDYALV